MLVSKRKLFFAPTKVWALHFWSAKGYYPLLSVIVPNGCLWGRKISSGATVVKVSSNMILFLSVKEKGVLKLWMDRNKAVYRCKSIRGEWTIRPGVAFLKQCLKHLTMRISPPLLQVLPHNGVTYSNSISHEPVIGLQKCWKMPSQPTQRKNVQKLRYGLCLQFFQASWAKNYDLLRVIAVHGTMTIKFYVKFWWNGQKFSLLGPTLLWF